MVSYSSFVPSASIVQGLDARLLIVPVPVFGCGVCLAGGAGGATAPGVPGCAPTLTVPGWVSFLVGEMIGAGQADAVRAQSRCQQARNASFQDQCRLMAMGPLPGVAGQAGRDVPDAVAGRVRVGASDLGVVAVAEDARPGGQFGGDVGRDDAPAMTCQFWRGASAGPWPWRCGRRLPKARKLHASRIGPREPARELSTVSHKSIILRSILLRVGRGTRWRLHDSQARAHIRPRTRVGGT
jgi:hypothetical protein